MQAYLIVILLFISTKLTSSGYHQLAGFCDHGCECKISGSNGGEYEDGCLSSGMLHRAGW
jgi:hypothetical protein